MFRQFTVLSLCCLLFSSVQAQLDVPYETFVQAGDNQELIDAINAANNGTGARRIVIVPGSSGELGYLFTMPIAGTSDALPMITSRIEFIVRGANDQRVTFRRDTNAPPFRFLTVGQGGSLLMRIVNVEDFSINGNGGAVLVQGNGLFSANRVGFNRNFASGNGGAVASTDNGRIYVSRLDLMNNRANVVGGVFSVEGDSTASIGSSVFRDNTAGVFGCAVNLNSQGTFFQQTLGLFGNTFQAGCDNVLIENPRGIIDVRGNTFFGLGEGIDSADTVRLFSSIFDLGPPGRRSMQKATCNDFGNGAFQSDGFNIDTADDCFLDHPTDQINTDPMLTVSGPNATPSLLASSPAIDAGASEITNAVQEKNGLPCPYVDARGLGRPQDANLDGVYECDIGSYEVQGGPDIGAAQSAAISIPHAMAKVCLLKCSVTGWRLLPSSPTVPMAVAPPGLSVSVMWSEIRSWYPTCCSRWAVSLVLPMIRIW